MMIMMVWNGMESRQPVHRSVRYADTTGPSVGYNRGLASAQCTPAYNVCVCGNATEVWLTLAFGMGGKREKERNSKKEWKSFTGP